MKMKIEYRKPYFYYWNENSLYATLFTKEELEDFISEAQALLRDVEEEPESYE